MPKGTRSITLVGYGLSIFYAISFFAFLQGGRGVTSQFSGLALLSLLSLLAVIFSLLLAQGKEYGRIWLIVTNVLFLSCGSILYLAYRSDIDAQRGLWTLYPIYLFLSLAVTVYLGLPEVRVQSQPGFQYNRKSILVVDDDEGLQKMVKRILLNHGYSVLSATSGEKGLQIAQRQQPDLIVLDVILPGVKGREVCARLKQDPLTDRIPVIFLTAKDSPDDIQAEIAAGAVSHLTKPINPKILLDEIKKVLK